jgi:hypothetical protein
VSKSKTTKQYVASQQSGVERSEGINISNWLSEKPLGGRAGPLFTVRTITSLQNICFGYDCHVIQTKTADVDNYKLRVHLCAILYLLWYLPMSHPENLLPPSCRTFTYVITQSLLCKTVIEARAELIAVRTYFYCFLSLVCIVERTDGKDLPL